MKMASKRGTVVILNATFNLLTKRRKKIPNLGTEQEKISGATYSIFLFPDRIQREVSNLS